MSEIKELSAKTMPKVPIIDLNNSTESRSSQIGQKHFVLFQDLYPHIFLSAELVHEFQRKIDFAQEPKLINFYCSKKFKSDNIFGKGVYFFEKFYMLDPIEVPNFQDEYNIIGYTNSKKQCEKIIKAFEKDLNTAIPCLTFENCAKSDKLVKNHGFYENLNLFDFIFLQNYRILMFFNKTEFEFEFSLIFPAFNFVYESIRFLYKMQSSPLAKRLLGKDPSNELAQPTFGFFSKDSSSRLVPLEYDNEDIGKVGLFGFWTYGIEVTDELLDNSKTVKQLVWGLHAHFLKNSKLGPKDYFLQNKAYFYAAFNKTGSPRAFSTRIVDMDGSSNGISEKMFKIKVEKGIDTEIDFTMFNPLETNDKEQTFLEPEIDSSLKLTKLSKTQHQKNGSFFRNSNLDLSEIGIQTEIHESFEGDQSIIKYIKKNEGFYRQTIDKMQEQINLLSQAVLSINQTLNLINLKQNVHPSQTQTPPLLNEEPNNGLNDLTSKSITISESSNQLCLGKDEISRSKILSEVKKSPKHRRYRTEEIQILHLRKESIVNKNQSEDFTNFAHQKGQSIDQNIDNPVENDVETVNQKPTSRNRTPEVKNNAEESILKKLNDINIKNEYSLTNVNNNSIPLPKINTRFQNYNKNTNETDDSEDDNSKDFKNIHKKYVGNK